MSIELKSAYHLFRYASEWDPREKGKTKGGYLEGKIHLPRVTEGLKVVISTHPTSMPEGAPTGVEDIHPTLLHVVRKTRNRRMNELEPVPNIHHWKQEFLIVNNRVTVVNRVSNLDELRNVPDQDELFRLNDERVLTFGKDVGDLNMIILIPKTDARAHGKDVTLKDLLRSRIQDENAITKMEEHYKGKNSVNLKQMKLKVEFFKLSELAPFSSAVSETISDTASKQLGALDFHDATPLKSCQTGGRKVMMVAEFGLAGDVEPRFQLWDRNGHRQRHLEDDPEYITQPMAIHKEPKETVAVFRESIIFITPNQNNLHKIIQGGFSITLVGRRKSDGVESRRKFVFSYIQHNERCPYCDINPDGLDTDDTSKAELAPKKLVPRPGRKKRIMSGGPEMDPEMSPPKQRKYSGESSKARASPTDDVIYIKTEESDSKSGFNLSRTVENLIPTTPELSTRIQHMAMEEPIYAQSFTTANTYTTPYTTLQSTPITTPIYTVPATTLQTLPVPSPIYTRSITVETYTTPYTTLQCRPIPQVYTSPNTEVKQAYLRVRSEEQLLSQPQRDSVALLRSNSKTSTSVDQFLSLCAEDTSTIVKTEPSTSQEESYQEAPLNLVKVPESLPRELQPDTSLHPKLRYKSKSNSV